MARLPRIVIPNHPLHIMHRGNNRQDIFENEDDMTRIKEDIAQALSKSDCSLHAYVIMSNHLHLLISPADKEQLSKFMQTMANRYMFKGSDTVLKINSILLLFIKTPSLFLYELFKSLVRHLIIYIKWFSRLQYTIIKQQLRGQVFIFAAKLGYKAIY